MTDTWIIYKAASYRNFISHWMTLQASILRTEKSSFQRMRQRQRKTVKENISLLAKPKHLLWTPSFSLNNYCTAGKQQLCELPYSSHCPRYSNSLKSNVSSFSIPHGISYPLNESSKWLLINSASAAGQFAKTQDCSKLTNRCQHLGATWHKSKWVSMLPGEHSHSQWLADTKMAPTYKTTDPCAQNHHFTETTTLSQPDWAGQRMNMLLLSSSLRIKKKSKIWQVLNLTSLP